MQKLYKQRHDFAVIGLTGRSGAGCSEIANKLSDSNYINDSLIQQLETLGLEGVDKVKLDICIEYLRYPGNWKPFKVIQYTDVLLFLTFTQIFYVKKSSVPVCLTDYIDELLNKENKPFTNKSIIEIQQIEKQIIEKFESKYIELNIEDANDINAFKRLEYKLIFKLFNEVEDVLQNLTTLLNETDLFKTKLFFHFAAISFRKNGELRNKDDNVNGNDSDNLFCIAEIINKLIKGFRNIESSGRVVIDSVKNSLELSFFHSRYSAFYCIATNKITDERIEYKSNTSHGYIDKLFKLDDFEYKGKEVAKGMFSSPDIENCIQRSGYHVFYTQNYEKYKSRLSAQSEKEVNLDIQLIKFIALLDHPGIITPTAIERNMQFAFTAKANSGCISRQVGAVITDINHSVKATGWNDVASGQMPCNLRNINDLIEKKNEDHFSSFEKGDLPLETYADEGDFSSQVASHLKEVNQKGLKGKNCSFCFKTFHNVFEGKANQVHTRSLHAEENAMLQLTKYGGQGIKGGTLYTTASPCELCSKKAFQLGIETIIYIDPYPGIATNHILKSGKEEKHNPRLIMFQGAVGKAYHKLYDPFLSYKDELNILIDLHPKMNQDRIIKKLTNDKEKQKQIKEVLENNLTTGSKNKIS